MKTAFEEWLALHEQHFAMGDYQTKDLAKYLGLHRRTVEHWIKGRKVIKDEYQEKIKKYLDNYDNIQYNTPVIQK